jgi:hypothetical protein
LLPDKVGQQFAEVAPVENCDIIYGPVLLDYCDPYGTPSSWVTSTIDPATDIYAQWLSWQLPQTGGALWSKKFLEKLCDEHELYMRAIQAGGQFQFAPTANAVYRIWSDETRSRATPGLLISQKSRLIVEMREWLLHRNLWTVEHEAIAGRACLEMCRTLARYDLSTANRRFQQFKRMNLIALSGPAAPKRYRGAYKIVGFMGAELAARGLRAINGR